MGGHYLKHQGRVHVGAVITLHYIRHSRLRNITTSLIKEVCLDSRNEPILQKVKDERFEQRTANTVDEARLGVAARGFAQHVK